MTESIFLQNLLELKTNNKLIINKLTSMANEFIPQAEFIINIIEKYMSNVSPQLVLPLMYLIDSMCKNDESGTYAKIFGQRIVQIFSEAFNKVSVRLLKFATHIYPCSYRSRKK